MAIVTRQQYLARSTLRDVGGLIDWAWRIVAWPFETGASATLASTLDALSGRRISSDGSDVK